MKNGGREWPRWPRETNHHGDAGGPTQGENKPGTRRRPSSRWRTATHSRRVELKWRTTGGAGRDPQGLTSGRGEEKKKKTNGTGGTPNARRRRKTEHSSNATVEIDRGKRHRRRARQGAREGQRGAQDRLTLAPGRRRGRTRAAVRRTRGREGHGPRLR